MTMSISPEDERILEDAVKSGQFKDKEQALRQALRSLGEKSSSDNGLDGLDLPVETWREKFLEHLAATPPTAAGFVDVTRESIYEGRGE